MRRFASAVVATALMAGSVAVTAQTGTADGVSALARGEYERAAAILRPIAERDTGGEPAAQFFLAAMYEQGRGVPRDPLRACALYHRAGGSGENPFSEQASHLLRAAFQRNGAEFYEDCGLLANLGFDHRFEPVTFDLAAGHSIAWTLKGATVSYRGRTKQHRLPLGTRGAAFLPLRYTVLATPGQPGRIRHFVEVFLWLPGPRTAWSLSWHLFEVAGDDLIRIADGDAIMTMPLKPSPSPSEDVRQRVEVRVTAEGQFEWAILEGPAARTEPIESAEERREVREAAAARDAAMSKVDWERTYDVRRLPSLTYGVSDGCANLFLYAYSTDRAEAIALRADRAALQLATAGSFELARHPDAIALNVHVLEQPMRGTMFCTDVGLSPRPVTEMWRAVAGRVTIELSPPAIRAKSPSLYRATIRIENAEFIDSSGRRYRQTAPILLSAVVGSGFG